MTDLSPVGKSCVATRCEAVEECVIHGETGFLDNTGDTDALRKSILELVSNPHLRREMGEKAIILEKRMSEDAEKLWFKVFTTATS